MTSDVEMAIDAARWGATHAQRWLRISCALMSAALLVGIVLWRPWLLASAAWFALNARTCRRDRNRELLRLHHMGAVRWMGADPEEFGRALRARGGK